MADQDLINISAGTTDAFATVAALAVTMVADTEEIHSSQFAFASCRLR